MRLTVLACALVTLAVGVTVEARAQEAVTQVSAPPAGPSAGPTWENATLGYQAEAATSGDMTWDSERRSSRSTGRTLAIVGGVAFIGGLIIEGDAGTAIAVGGLVIGLIGLYQWLK